MLIDNKQAWMFLRKRQNELVQLQTLTPWWRLYKHWEIRVRLSVVMSALDFMYANNLENKP